MNRPLLERLLTVLVGAGIVVAAKLLKIDSLDYIGVGVVAWAVPHVASRPSLHAEDGEKPANGG